MHRNALRYAATLALGLVELLGPRAASATYSLAAANAATGEVGGAGTSCVGNYSVFVIYGSVPGHGVVHAQAQANIEGRDRAVLRLTQDTPPEAIIAELTAPLFDPSASTRQYGIVDRSGRAAGFSGRDTLPFSADRQGTLGDLAYSVQGNILTSQRVLDQAEAAFRFGGCDLADRLMRALEAGAENGEGDRRCTPSGIPSDGAFIEVDRPGEPSGAYLRLRVDDTAPQNPLVRLRADFDRWRIDHPCPARADGGEDGPDVLRSNLDASIEPDGAASSAGDAMNEGPEAFVDGGAREMAPRARATPSRCSAGEARMREGSVAWSAMFLLGLLATRRRTLLVRAPSC